MVNFLKTMSALMLMKFAHNIKITVFAKPGENREQIKTALISLVPPGDEKEKYSLTESSAEGFEGNIAILELLISKERIVTGFVKRLKSILSEEQRNTILCQDNRVDDECYFYIRLDKKKLLDGEYELTESGDCFHIRMSIAAFPKKREAALAVVRKMMG
jgi:RNA-binding protein